MSLIGFSELVNHMTVILELKMLPLRDLDYWVRVKPGLWPCRRGFPLGSALYSSPGNLP